MNEILYRLDIKYPSTSWAQSAGDVEYTDYISAKGKNEYPAYDIKQFDGETPVMLEFWCMYVV